MNNKFKIDKIYFTVSNYVGDQSQNKFMSELNYRGCLMIPGPARAGRSKPQVQRKTLSAAIRPSRHERHQSPLWI